MVQKQSEVKKVNIIRERRQLSVRFPTEFSDRFDIDIDKDMFEFIVIESKEGKSLQGRLLKNAKNKDT